MSSIKKNQWLLNLDLISNFTLGPHSDKLGLFGIIDQSVPSLSPEKSGSVNRDKSSVHPLSFYE